MKIIITEQELPLLEGIFKELANVNIISIPCEPIPGVEIEQEVVCTKSSKKAVR